MTIDLSKPIRRKTGVAYPLAEARYYGLTPDGKLHVVSANFGGKWYAQGLPQRDLELNYENVPPPTERFYGVVVDKRITAPGHGVSEILDDYGTKVLDAVLKVTYLNDRVTSCEIAWLKK